LTVTKSVLFIKEISCSEYKNLRDVEESMLILGERRETSIYHYRKLNDVNDSLVVNGHDATINY
jgi:hypothetical protein